MIGIAKVEANNLLGSACNFAGDALTLSYNIAFCCNWDTELCSVVLSKCFHGSSHNTSGFSFLSVFAFL